MVFILRRTTDLHIRPNLGNAHQSVASGNKIPVIIIDRNSRRGAMAKLERRWTTNPEIAGSSPASLAFSHIFSTMIRWLVYPALLSALAYTVPGILSNMLYRPTDPPSAFSKQKLVEKYEKIFENVHLSVASQVGIFSSILNSKVNVYSLRSSVSVSTSSQEKLRLWKSISSATMKQLVLSILMNICLVLQSSVLLSIINRYLYAEEVIDPSKTVSILHKKSFQPAFVRGLLGVHLLGDDPSGSSKLEFLLFSDHLLKEQGLEILEKFVDDAMSLSDYNR